MHLLDMALALSTSTDCHQVTELREEEENFVRLHLALQVICSEVLPCITSVVTKWHTSQTQTLQQCQSPQTCISKGKPKQSKSCSACIDWKDAIENVYYPQSSVDRIPWSNINPTLLYSSPVEIAKAFVFRLVAGKVHTTMGDFDPGSLLMIMMHFNEFHKGDSNTYEAISNVAKIRNSLSHMNVNENLRLDHKTTGDHFKDLQIFVQHLCPMHLDPQTTHDLCAHLKNLQISSIASFNEDQRYQETIQNLCEKMQEMQLQMRQISEPPGEADPDTFDVPQCRQELVRHYLQYLCKIPQFPGDKRNCLNMDDIFTNLSILIHLPKPCTPIQVPLQSHHEIFTQKTDNGIRSTRILVLGNPGCGKSILTAKLAHDWAVKNPDSPLKDVTLLFALNMRWMTPETTLEDSILQQLLPRDTKATKKSIRNYIETNQSDCIIVLDSYDEYGFSGEFIQHESSIHSILLNECLRDCLVMVTSRFWKAGDFDDLLTVYTQMQINGFSDENVSEYISKFFSHDLAAGESLRVYLMDHNLNPGIANVPLMTLLLCLYWKTYGGKDVPGKIGDLYSKILRLLHQQYLSKHREESIDLMRLIIEAGKVAFSGLWSPKDKLVFSFQEFGDGSSQQTIVDACRIGLLSVEQTSGGHVDILESDHVQGEILNESSLVIVDKSKSVTFFHKSCQEKSAGEFLANLAEVDHGDFISKLQYLDSTRTCMRLEMVLRFACGACPKAADFILRRLVQIFKSEFCNKIEQYYEESLQPDDAKRVQKFIELCLQCYYESPECGELHLLLTDLFPQETILFIGMSPYTSSAIGQYISRKKTIRSIVIKAIPSPNDDGLYPGGAIAQIWTIMQDTLQSLSKQSLQLISHRKKTYEDLSDYEKLCKIKVDDYFKDWQSSHGINLVQIFTSLADCDGLQFLQLINMKVGNQLEKLLDIIEGVSLNVLSELTLLNCGMDNKQVDRLLNLIVDRLPSLKKLDISYNKARLAYQGDWLVNTQMQCLFIRGMDAPAEDMSGLISRLLEFGPRMIVLSMEDNVIDDSGGKALANALSSACLPYQLEEFGLSVSMMKKNAHNKVIESMTNLTLLTQLRIRESPYVNDLLKCLSNAMGFQLLYLSVTKGVEKQSNESTLARLLPKLFDRGAEETQPVSRSVSQRFITKLDNLQKMKRLALNNIRFHKDDLVTLLALGKRHDYTFLRYFRQLFPDEIDVSPYSFLFFV